MRAARLYLSKVNECGGFRFASPPPFQRFLSHKDISEILRFSEISCSDKKKKKGLRGQWRGENHFFFSQWFRLQRSLSSTPSHHNTYNGNTATPTMLRLGASYLGINQSYYSLIVAAMLRNHRRVSK